MRRLADGTLAVLIAFLAVAASCRPAAAQSGPAARHRRVPVTLAISRHLPHAGEPYVLLRRPPSGGGDVILLADTATASTLSAALRLLMVSRQLDGDSLAAPATFRLRKREAGEVPRPVIPWVPRVLADLKGAEPKPVRGVGTVRAVQVWLPAQGNGRHRAAESGQPPRRPAQPR